MIVFICVCECTYTLHTFITFAVQPGILTTAEINTFCECDYADYIPVHIYVLLCTHCSCSLPDFVVLITASYTTEVNAI